MNKAIDNPWWAKYVLRMIEFLIKNVSNMFSSGETNVEPDVASIQRISRSKTLVL